jgi:hypothetical protein
MDGSVNTILFGISRPEMVADTIPKIRAICDAHGISEQQAIDSVTKNTINLMSQRKHQNPKVKIVAHVDYAIQLWHSPMLKDFFSPNVLERILSFVDYIFTAEPAMAHYLYSVMGGKRDVFLIPHPSNVHALKSMHKGIVERYGGKQFKENIIRSIIHRYDNNWMAPYIVTNNSFDKTAPGAPLCAAIAMDGSNQFVTELRSMGWEYVEVGSPHELWLEKMARTRVLVDSYHNINTYGRSCVEAACMKTPLIGSSITYLQDIIFPKITSAPNHIQDQCDMLNRLLTDGGFVKEVTDYAYEKVDMVNYENSRNNFELMLNGGMVPFLKGR